MQDKNDIPFQHWSLKIGRRDPDTGDVAPQFGSIVVAVDDLHQSITTLILTPLGAVPTEPEKGCDLMPYLDRHFDEAAPNVTRAIWDAITMWEPRVVLQDINVFLSGEAQLTVAVYWRPTQSVLDDLLVTEVSLNDAQLPARRVA